MKKYYTTFELINFIDNPNREKCFQLYADNEKIFEIAKGSNVKHQDWVGGYIDHINETMNIAVVLYDSLNSLRDLKFSLSDALLVLFLHDIEKPWKYSGCKKSFEFFNSFETTKDFQKYIIQRYGFVITPEQTNALLYIHGENEDYDPYIRKQKPLAAFVHNCDIISARIWFDYPIKKNNW